MLAIIRFSELDNCLRADIGWLAASVCASSLKLDRIVKGWWMM